MAHAHQHGRGGIERPAPQRAAQRRALLWALALNGALLVAEVVGGVVYGSLALLADGAHMLTDVVGLTIAVVAVQLMSRPPTERHSYGLQRSEVLAAQANGVLLVIASVVIVVESVGRLADPQPFDGLPTLIIATAGLVANALSAVLVGREAGQSLNLRGAMAHLLADAGTSVGVMVAAVAALAWNADWADPVVSLVIAVVVLWAAWGLLRDTTHVLLEGTPRHLDPAEVVAALAADPTVAGVHHLHVWDLASDTVALSAHVVMEGEITLHDAQRHADRLKQMLGDRFGVAHATLEVECHACEPTSEVFSSEPPQAG